MDQAGQNYRAFGRLFLDREGQDLLKFSSSVFDMMNLFSQAIFRVGLDAQPGLSSSLYHVFNINQSFIKVSVISDELELYIKLLSKLELNSTTINICNWRFLLTVCVINQIIL